MLKSRALFLHLAVLGLSLWGVRCLTEDERVAVFKALTPMIVHCKEECGVTEQIDAKEAGKHYEKMNPCVKKCILTSLGVLDNNGNYDRDQLKNAFVTYTGNEKEAIAYQQALDECLKGKDEELRGDKDAETKKVEIFFNCVKGHSQI